MMDEYGRLYDCMARTFDDLEAVTLAMKAEVNGGTKDSIPPTLPVYLLALEAICTRINQVTFSREGS